MKIKTRLSLYFTLISCGALLLVLLTLYIASFGFLKSDFKNRLTDRLHVASQLYLTADEIDADSLAQIQQRYLEKLPGEVVRVYDDRNKIAFDPANGMHWNAAMISKVRREGYIEYEEGPRQVVGKYYHDNQGNFVILASAIDHNFKPRVLALARITAVLFVCFSAVLFFIGQWFAKNTLTPIQSIIQQMRNIGSANLHLRIKGARNNDEITALISNFNNLLQRLQNTFELQRNFVSNASHELRTPLTSLMGEADLALERPRTIEEYERVLTSISTDAMHLQNTVTSLMELAQADFGYTQAALQPVRIDELLWELQENWQQKRGADKFVLNFITLPDDESQLEVTANKSLLAIAFNNIIDNAFKYSNEAPVHVDLTATKGNIRISITDSGPGISEDEKQHIFKSFYRIPATKHVQGSGVGLYITAKIIERCNGNIAIQSDGNTGSSFIVTFSAASVVVD